MDEITKRDAQTRARALDALAQNVARHIRDGDMRALGHAVTGAERTIEELRRYADKLAAGRGQRTFEDMQVLGAEIYAESGR
jgi:hypothetical protein